VSEIQHFAFKSEYPNVSLRLVTEVEIYDVSQSPKKMKARALWDTGAMLSAITPEIAQSLSLVPFIQLGDFSISNRAGKTLFTFAMPPFEDKIDL